MAVTVEAQKPSLSSPGICTFTAGHPRGSACSVLSSPQCSPGSSTVCHCSTWIPCHMEEHPHPVSQVPGLCHGDVPKTNSYLGLPPPPAKVSKAEILVYPHTPCPLGRIPSWIYFCRFACLGMKGICRGRATIGRGGLEPPGPAFADQRVTFPGNLGDPGGQGLLLGFHVGSFRMVFH